MITFQNVSSEKQVKISFFVKKLCSVLKIFKFLYFSPFYDLENLWRHDDTSDRAHFWIYLLNRNSLRHQTWPIEISQTWNFLNSLEDWAKFQVLFNVATCSNYSITNHVKISVFHFFEKVNKGHLKTVTVNY